MGPVTNLQRDCKPVPEWDGLTDKSGYGAGQIYVVRKHFCSDAICKDLYVCWYTDQSDGKHFYYLPVNGNTNISKLKV